MQSRHRNAELAGRAWHALSKVLFEFTRAKTGRSSRKVPILQRVNAADVERFLYNLQDKT
jgi:hypothetical protein